MHSKIFQITETRVDRDNYLNEDTLEQGDGHYYDYCSEIDEEERKFHIANLIEKSLPKGMFTLVGENTIRYNGGADIIRFVPPLVITRENVDEMIAILDTCIE